jgi:hypothetical protein
MLSFIHALIAGLTLVSAQIPSPNITISTLPTFSTCQPAIINWSGGSCMSISHFQLLRPWYTRQLTSSTIQGVHLPERLD